MAWWARSAPGPVLAGGAGVEMWMLLRFSSNPTVFSMTDDMTKARPIFSCKSEERNDDEWKSGEKQEEKQQRNVAHFGVLSDAYGIVSIFVLTNKLGGGRERDEPARYICEYMI